MSDDLVERLRNPSGIGEPMDHMAMSEAATEIERLRAAIVTAKREAPEEAAKVADKYLDSSDRSVLAAAKWIAEDIRALQEPK